MEERFGQIGLPGKVELDSLLAVVYRVHTTHESHVTCGRRKHRFILAATLEIHLRINMGHCTDIARSTPPTICHRGVVVAGILDQHRSMQ